MTEMKRPLRPGIYLVVDPSMEEAELLRKLALVLQENIAAVQIWDNFSMGQQKEQLIQKVLDLAHARQVPVLINNQWELLRGSTLDGVHFDAAPANFAAVQKDVGRPFLAGVTCGNDLWVVQWATEVGLDYLSFCSLFPSATSTSCELVNFASVLEARRISGLPIFLAGGIKPDNLPELDGLPYDGIAVVSGIMGAAEPAASVRAYADILKQKKP